MEVGGEGDYIYLSLHCHHQNDTCIKTGSDESRFNVSLIVRDKVTRPCPQTTTFLKRKESRSGIEPRSFRLPAYRLTARLNRLSITTLKQLRGFDRTVQQVHGSTGLKISHRHPRGKAGTRTHGTNRKHCGL